MKENPKILPEFTDDEIELGVDQDRDIQIKEDKPPHHN
jgi:hypothetical protein